MASDRENLEHEAIGQLADRMQDGPNSGRIYYAALAELQRRQSLSQMATTNAQKDAAEAAKDTAEYTKKNARYMLWSVIAVLATSGVAAIFQFLTWYMQRPH